MGVRMDRDEALAFVAKSHTGILTTLRRDGMPIALPVWFVVRDGQVYIATPSHTKKVARIRADPRVSFLTESGKRWAELKAVQLNGEARVVEDPSVLDEVRALLGEKYAAYRTARQKMPTGTQKHYAGGQTVFEIVPHGRVLSWDNTKLHTQEAPK